jgi:hypothetical protein
MTVQVVCRVLISVGGDGCARRCEERSQAEYIFYRLHGFLYSTCYSTCYSSFYILYTCYISILFHLHNAQLLNTPFEDISKEFFSPFQLVVLDLCK